MPKSTFPILVTALKPETLVVRVRNEIAKGSDLYTQPFVAYTGEICQYVVPGAALSDYRLIDAVDLQDLETQVENLAQIGFDFIFSTLMWNGRYLQWMHRMNEMGQDVKAVLVEGVTIPDFDKLIAMAEPLLHVDLRVVESAQPVMRGKFLMGDR